MYFLTADGDIYYYHSATQKMQKLAALSTVAGQTSPTGNFLLKDKWMILTTTGVYTYNFATGEVAADPRLNIKKGELIRDNHGDYWIYNHTGHLTYVVAATGESKDFQLIPQDKINWNISLPTSTIKVISVRISCNMSWKIVPVASG